MNDILVADKTVAVTIPKSKTPARQQKRSLLVMKTSSSLLNT